jgi:hypothetical protein
MLLLLCDGTVMPRQTHIVRTGTRNSVLHSPLNTLGTWQQPFAQQHLHINCDATCFPTSTLAHFTPSASDRLRQHRPRLEMQP